MTEQGNNSDRDLVLTPEEEKQRIKEHAAITKRIAKDKEQLDVLNNELGPHHAKKIGPALDNLKELIDASVIRTEIRKQLEQKLIEIVKMVTDKYEMIKIGGIPSSSKTTIDVPRELLAWMRSNANSAESAKSKPDIEIALGVPENHKFKQNQWDKFREDYGVMSVMEGKNKRSVKYHLYIEEMKSSGS